MKGVSHINCVICGLIISSQTLFAFNPQALIHPVMGDKGMVATQDLYATQIGVDILNKGGNAIDAAVAIGYAMAVTHPQAGNLGGGGFMLIYSAKHNQTYALDYREKAPLAAHKDMYLDANGNANAQLSRFSALSVGVPGTVAGLEAAHSRFGQLNRRTLINPAIKLAKKGFVVQHGLVSALKQAQSYLTPHQATKATFYKGDDYFEVNDILKQPQLAQTLTQIKHKGSAGFYKGKLAQDFVDYLSQQGGIITLADLAAYQPVWRTPITGTYKGYQIASMPPPSSGGIALIQTLNILQALPLAQTKHNSADYIHYITEALKYTYKDRATYLGDTDFVSVPIKQLTSIDYANQCASTITLNAILDVNQLSTSNITMSQSNDTTHFVVADQYGNVVSNTYTLNFSFGNGMTVPKLGILLNNEMDDFSAKPGVPNAYGLIGNDKNSIAPQKRMLSSMTPSLVFKDNKPYIVTGSPGGSRIITTTLQVILNVIEHNMNIAQAVGAPRFHHQWKPDVIRIEQGFSNDTLNLLHQRGYKTVLKSSMGSAQSILVTPSYFYGTADTRKPDALAQGAWH